MNFKKGFFKNRVLEGRGIVGSGTLLEEVGLWGRVLWGPYLALPRFTVLLLPAFQYLG